MDYLPQITSIQLHPLTALAGTQLMPRNLSTFPEIRDASGLFAEIDAVDFDNFGIDAGDVVEWQFHPAPPEVIEPPSLDSTLWSGKPAANFSLDQSERYDPESSSGLSDSGSESDALNTASGPADQISQTAVRLGLGVTAGVVLGSGTTIGIIFGATSGTSSSHSDGNSNGGDPAPSDDSAPGSADNIPATPALVGESPAQVDPTEAAALASELRLDFLEVDLILGEFAFEPTPDHVDIVATGIASFELNF